MNENYEIKFLEEEIIHSKGTRITKGECKRRTKGNKGEIKIYSGHDDKLRTLVHEIIHNYLFEKSRKGYFKRFIDKLNYDENFVDGLAINISKAIKENEKKLKQ